jgi:acetolactate synthase I/II/III large subunit
MNPAPKSPIKVSDLIVNELVRYGIKHVFMITGGGAMHLNDSVGKNKNLTYICNHHEQASAIAAEGYARITGRLAVVFVTTGPGGLNTLTGVMGQWTDSVPVLYISGQVKYETTIDSCRSIGLRQLGDQEVDIISIVKPLTKFAETIKDPLDARKLLRRAISSATSGRPGPVWLDVPLNVQGAIVDEEKMNKYEESIEFSQYDSAKMIKQANEIAQLLSNTKRPVFLVGNGVRISGARQTLLNFALTAGIPLVTSFLGCDIVPTNHPCYVGRVGTIGNRAGNFCLQNSDLLITLGSRNNIRQISYNWKPFAHAAKRIFVDIDSAELEKPTIFPHIKVHANVADFLDELIVRFEELSIPDWSKWLEWCLTRREKYPAYLEEYSQITSLVHPYHFVYVFNKLLRDNDIVVTGNATPSIVYFQTGEIKIDQRAIWNSGCAAMGYDVPASIGAAVGAGIKQRIICFAGDGSIQMNIQELQTIRHHNLPIKIFVFENNGYVSIIQTQKNLFGGHFVGCSPEFGVSFPDFTKVFEAYNIPAFSIDSHDDLDKKISKVLTTEGPYGCVVKLVRDYKFSPKTSSEKLPDGRIVSKPLEDMFPFLNRQEFGQNMLVPEWDPAE